MTNLPLVFLGDESVFTFESVVVSEFFLDIFKPYTYYCNYLPCLSFLRNQIKTEIRK